MGPVRRGPALRASGSPTNHGPIKAIKKIINDRNIIIIEDNCESLGSLSNSKKLGTLGLASSHSFYFGHHISTIECGMISTNDKRFYNISLAIRSHGWARDMQKAFRKKYSQTSAGKR